ncbi:hypothetical protein BT96DRAFT_784954, partial [Gymnopus androsaceus JB14]
CQHPHDCIRQATKPLHILPPKWDPRQERPEDYQKLQEITDDNENRINFDNRVRTNGSLADIFRIFTNKDSPMTNELPE